MSAREPRRTHNVDPRHRSAITHRWNATTTSMAGERETAFPAPARPHGHALPGACHRHRGARPPSDLGTIFPAAVNEVRLEIGFGGGERLIDVATRRERCRLHRGRALPERHGKGRSRDRRSRPSQHPSFRRRRRPPPRLAARGVVSEIDLFYPDPWPKKRHFKRRFVSPANLDRFARVLAPGRSVPVCERHRLLCRMDAPPPEAAQRFRLDRRAGGRLAAALSGLAGHALRGEGAGGGPQAGLPDVRTPLTVTDKSFTKRTIGRIHDPSSRVSVCSK